MTDTTQAAGLDNLALAFHRATTDQPAGAEDLECIKRGLNAIRAALAAQAVHADGFHHFFISRAPGRVPRIGFPVGDLRTSVLEWLKHSSAGLDVVTWWADGGPSPGTATVETAADWLYADDPESIPLVAASPAPAEAPATDIDEAALARMTELGAKAWAGVDAQSLRDGTYAPAEAKPWRLWECSQTTGVEWIAITGSDETEMRRALREYHEHGRDVWLIAPDGSKHLPEAAPAEAKAKPKAYDPGSDTALAVGELIHAMSAWKATSPTNSPPAFDKLVQACRWMVQAATPQPQAAQPVGYADIIDRVSNAVGYGPGAWDLVDPGALVRAILREAAAPALTEEQERDRQDARRYRWLRENRSVTLLTAFFGNGCINKFPPDIDAYIDAALRSTQGGK